MALLQQTKYEPLTVDSAVTLAKKLGLFSEDSVLTCAEIGDGNLNYVFRIADKKNGKSIIIKQALPYAKVVGESWPLTLKRATIEAEALKIFRDIAPEYVPEVYFSDEALAITVMADLSHLSIARTGLIGGEQYPLLSKHLGEYLAKVIYRTSDYGLGPIRKKELVQKFINPELCKITEDLIFTDPFVNAATNSFEEELKHEVEALWNDDQVKLEAALLKKSFLTEAEALLHGDLHTGSIFAGERETKVIDPEFAFYGPVGFDVGQVIANLLFQAISAPQKEDFIFTHVNTFWNTFEFHFSNLWESENVDAFEKITGYLPYLLNKYFTDAIGFAGCELIRRTIGLAHVADLDGIENKNDRLKAKRAALEIGKQLIVNRKKMEKTADLLAVVLDNR